MNKTLLSLVVAAVICGPGIPAQAAFQPSDLANLALWLDASDAGTVVVDGSGFIQQWSDKSLGGYHAGQPVTAERPVLNSTAMNGLPAVRFDGVDDGLIIADSLSLSRPYTAFIVDQYYGATQGRTLQSRDINWLMGKWAGKNGHYADGWVTNSGANWAGTGNPAIGEAMGLSSRSYYFLDGNNITNSYTPTGVPGKLGLVSEGAYGGEVSQADVAEVIIYDRLLTEPERQQVGAYLQGKYGISGGYDDSATDAPHTIVSTAVGAFGGGDPGEGLDMQGDFIYAVNARGPAPAGPVGDANFTDEAGEPGVTIVAQNNSPNWHNPNYGGSANDNNLETVMQSIRWSEIPNPVTTTMTDLMPGYLYKLQLLFGESCCNRGFDVFLDGALLADDFNPGVVQGGSSSTASQGAVVSVLFWARDDTANVLLSGISASDPDHNPILQGLTLELVAVPEPATLAIWSLLAGLGIAAGWRRKRQ